MRTNRHVFRLAGLVVATLVPVALAAGCGGASHGGGHGDDQATASPTGTASATVAYNQADIAFAQEMIPHHQQAVQMAELGEARASDPKVKELAAKIKAAQQPEIEQMTAMLRDWAVPMPSPSSGGHGTHGGSPTGAMPGMMSEQDMASLEKADGGEFDRMFLEMMIQHHQGAVQMSDTELQQGQNPAAKDLAAKIKADQTAEIGQMRSMLSGK
ncbi:DUF305 domain-containing protein [Plantactinospora sp. DSM 117369]